MKKILLIIITFKICFIVSLFSDLMLKETIDYPRRLFRRANYIRLEGDKIYIADNRSIDVYFFPGFNEVQQIEHRDMREPNGFVFHKDKIYVCDTRNDKILVFNLDGSLDFKFGGGGRGYGKLDDPIRIVADNNNRIYVANQGNSVISVFSDEGVLYDYFSISSDRTNIVDMIIDRNNNIYVLDDRNCNIKKFSNEGKLLATISRKGSANNELDNPVSIFIDETDRIYVADEGNHKIVVFNTEGGYLSRLGSRGTGRGQFRNLEKVFVNDSKLFALDTRNRNIQVFNISKKPVEPEIKFEKILTNVEIIKNIKIEDIIFMRFLDENSLGIIRNRVNKLEILDINTGEIIKSAGGSGRRDGQFRDLVSFSKTVDGLYLLLDSRNCDVSVFDKELNYKEKFLSRGRNLGDLRNPVSIAYDKDSFYLIADNQNNRIDVFGRDWVYRKSIQFPVSNRDLSPAVIKFDKQNILYILDNDNEVLVKYDYENMNVISFIRGMEDIPDFCIDDFGNVYTVDKNYHRVTKRNNNLEKVYHFGKEGTYPGSFSSPSQIDIINNDILAVADENGIQLFNIIKQPDIPDNFNITAGIRENHLSWNDSLVPNLKYIIYSSKTSKPLSNFEAIHITEKSYFVHENLLNNTEYFYFITAVSNRNIESQKSQIKNAVTLRGQDIYSEKAMASMNRRNYDTALIFIKKALEIEPNNPKLIYEKGLIYYNKQAYREAVEYLARAISIDPREEWRKQLQLAEVKFEDIYGNIAELEIAEVRFNNIFPAKYKFYTENPVGEFVIKNNTRRVFNNVKIGFIIKDYMDFPTEKIIPEIKDFETVTVDITADLNNRIFNIDESTHLQTEIQLTYYTRGQEEVYTITNRINVYARNSLVWDDDLKICAFVTPNDMPVRNFARRIINHSNELDYLRLPENVKKAALIFNYFIANNFRYVRDPNNAYYATAEERINMIDAVQFARESLDIFTGDCDDLTVLFASLLESVGVQTAMVYVPEHIFMAFNTELDRSEMNQVTNNEANVIVMDNQIWIPVEITELSSSFLKSWSVGAYQINKYASKNELVIIKTADGWNKYQPVTLPSTRISFQLEKIDEALNITRTDLYRLSERYVNSIIADIRQNLYDKNNEIPFYLQAGIVYGQEGMLDNAEKYFLKVIENDTENANALNNLGNIYYIRQDYEKALELYNTALKYDDNDGGIYLNISLIHYHQNRMTEAADFFDKATKINEKIAVEYSNFKNLISR